MNRNIFEMLKISEIRFILVMIILLITNCKALKNDLTKIDPSKSDNKKDFNTRDNIPVDKCDSNCKFAIETFSGEDCDKSGYCHGRDYGPQSSVVLCEYLPLDFVDCDELIDHKGDEKSFKESGLGCLKFGGQSVKDVQTGSRRCTALKSIQCYGNHSFIRQGFPCVRYNGHYFVTTLLFSLLLGFFGMDRFYLGHTGTAIGKLLTIGGIGLWWVVDIVLLVTGNLSPEDGSNWMPHA